MFLIRHTFLLTLTLLVVIAIVYRQEIFDLPVEEDISTDAPSLVSEHGNTAGTDGPPLQMPVRDGGQTSTVNPSPDQDTSAPLVEAELELAELPGDREGLPETVRQPTLTTEESPEAEEVSSPVRDGESGQPSEESADNAVFDRDADLAAAREAYWKGDQLLAIERYRSLIGRIPDDVEAHGELGNILFELGRNEEAAIEYRAAIAQLIRSGERVRAEGILRVLRVYDPGSAVSVERGLAPGGPGAANK